MESWVYGIIFTFIAAFGSTTGLIFAEKSLMKQSSRKRSKAFHNQNGMEFRATNIFCAVIFLALIPLPFEFFSSNVCWSINNFTNWHGLHCCVRAVDRTCGGGREVNKVGFVGYITHIHRRCSFYCIWNPCDAAL